MYNLPYFKERDRKEVMEFIKTHPFAFITGCDTNNKPVATQIPIFIEERDDRLFLIGHMMRNTDHHLAFIANSNVLCVFTGANSYVSATWYDDPKQASTWNYISVYIYGKIHFLDELALTQILQKTSLYFEGGETSSSTVFNNLSSEYSGKLMKAIVGFEVEIEHKENVFKLSQNRNEKSYRNIISELKKKDPGAIDIASEMEKREKALFKK
jgi:transcriptional regulator